MSSNRKFARGPSAYRRGKPRFQPSGKSFLIVTEGEKTEPNYFQALRNRLQLNAAEVVIEHPQGTDPITLTTKAIELCDARRKEAKQGFVIPYDEVWVVFDLEKPHDQRRKLAVKAMALGKAAGIRFAVSNPAFEFWLLLHEEYTTTQFAGCDAIIKRLEKHWTAYSKGQIPSHSFLDKMPIAVQNAQRCREHHKTCAGDGNPSTDVDLLARTLNSATRLHLQFILVEAQGLYEQPNRTPPKAPELLQHPPG